MVGDLVGALAVIGLVQENAPRSRTGTGRPSLVVSLDTERGLVLAVELAAEALVVVRVGLGGEILERLVQPPGRGVA